MERHHPTKMKNTVNKHRDLIFEIFHKPLKLKYKILELWFERETAYLANKIRREEQWAIDITSNSTRETVGGGNSGGRGSQGTPRCRTSRTRVSALPRTRSRVSTTSTNSYPVKSTQDPDSRRLLGAADGVHAGAHVRYHKSASWIFFETMRGDYAVILKCEVKQENMLIELSLPLNAPKDRRTDDGVDWSMCVLSSGLAEGSCGKWKGVQRSPSSTSAHRGCVSAGGERGRRGTGGAAGSAGGPVAVRRHRVFVWDTPAHGRQNDIILRPWHAANVTSLPRDLVA